MKTLIKILYGAATIGMFVLFFWFLDLRFAQFQAGGFAVAGIEKSQCESVEGLIITVQGQDRCYTSPTEYITGKDFGNSVEGGPKNFADCKFVGGEIVASESHGDRCYFTKKLFFDELVAEKNSTKTTEKEVEKEKIEIVEKPIEAVPEKEKPVKVVPVKNVDEPEKIIDTLIVNNFSSCKKEAGKIVEIPFNKRCYWSADKYFDEKNKQEVIASLRTFNDCQSYGGEMVKIPFNERCYVNDTKFFNKKTEAQVLNSLKNFSDCQQYGGKIFENQCYVSETKFFTK